MTRLSRRFLVALAASSALGACFPMADLGPFDGAHGSPTTGEGIARAFQLEGLVFSPIPIAKYTGGHVRDVFVSDGAAYCVTIDNIVYVTDLETGTPRWTLQLDYPVDPARGFAWGPDRVGFVSKNHLTVVSKRSGSRLLTADLQFTPSSAGLLTGDSFFAGAWGNGYSLRSATLVDGWSGWSHMFDDAITGKPVFLGAGTADATIVCASHDGRVVGIEPRSASGSAPAESWVVRTTGKNAADLATDGQLVFVACDDGVLYAISRGAGSTQWKWYDAGEPLQYGPTVANGLVYQPISSGVVCIDAATGKERHRIAGAKRYLTRIGERDFFANNDRTIVSVDTVNGAVVHQEHSPLFSLIAANPTGGALVFCDGNALYAIR